MAAIDYKSFTSGNPRSLHFSVGEICVLKFSDMISSQRLVTLPIGALLSFEMAYHFLCRLFSIGLVYIQVVNEDVKGAMQG